MELTHEEAVEYVASLQGLLDDWYSSWHRFAGENEEYPAHIASMYRLLEWLSRNAPEC